MMHRMVCGAAEDGLLAYLRCVIEGRNEPSPSNQVPAGDCGVDELHSLLNTWRCSRELALKLAKRAVQLLRSII